MPSSNELVIHVDVRYIHQVAQFLTAIQEIAGTTNDPNTAANIRAAIDQLYGRKTA